MLTLAQYRGVTPMKIILLTIALINISAHAKPCAPCTEMDALTKRFSKLQYSNADDRRVGRSLMDQVLRFTESYIDARNKGPSFDREIQHLVRLVAASTPYDVETAGAGDLVVLIREKGILSVYTKTVSTLTNRCQKNFLQAVMDARLCTREGCDEEKVPFDYEACLSRPSATP